MTAHKDANDQDEGRLEDRREQRESIRIKKQKSSVLKSATKGYSKPPVQQRLQRSARVPTSSAPPLLFCPQSESRRQSCGHYTPPAWLAQCASPALPLLPPSLVCSSPPPHTATCGPLGGTRSAPRGMACRANRLPAGVCVRVCVTHHVRYTVCGVRKLPLQLTLSLYQQDFY
jgi:hypothetical protein